MKLRDGDLERIAVRTEEVCGYLRASRKPVLSRKARLRLRWLEWNEWRHLADLRRHLARSPSRHPFESPDALYSRSAPPEPRPGSGYSRQKAMQILSSVIQFQKDAVRVYGAKRDETSDPELQDVLGRWQWDRSRQISRLQREFDRVKERFYWNG